MRGDLQKAVERAAEQLSQARRKHASRRSYAKWVTERAMAEGKLIADSLLAEGIDPFSPLGSRVFAELLAKAVPELGGMDEEEGLNAGFPEGW
jgi:hypothetical protein